MVIEEDLETLLIEIQKEKRDFKKKKRLVNREEHPKNLKKDQDKPNTRGHHVPRGKAAETRTKPLGGQNVIGKGDRGALKGFQE